MASLPANATQDEIEEELEFQQVLISSLDPGADDYLEKLIELQTKTTELEERLDALQQPEEPTLTQGLNMDGVGDGQIGGWQAQGTSQLGNSYNMNGYATYPTLPTQSINMKRPLPDSLYQDSLHPSKRPTPEPSRTGTPASSIDSFDNFDNSNSGVSEKARLRQLQAEAALKRRYEGQLEDERLARQLSQQQSQPRPSASSSFTPSFQTTLNNNGSYHRPPPSAKPEVPPMAPPPAQYPAPSPFSQSAKPMSNHRPSPQTPHIKSEPSASTQQQLAHRPRALNTEVIDLTASDSDDEDVSEVAPSSFTPSSRSIRPGYNNPYANQPVLPSQPLRPPMASSYPTRDANGNSFVYGNANNNVRQPYGWMQTNPVVAGAVNGIRNIGSSLGDAFSELNHLVNGYGHGHPQSSSTGVGESMYGGSRQPHPGRPPYAGYDDMDLYRRRYDEIADNNPAKTMEEINSLLENIRPDEDMPAHLRIQTPEALTIRLHKYQELGLTWLQKCEDGSNKGGILADEMGLGKTIQMLSLIVTHKSEDPRCKTTLIVAPVALMRQWKQEIEQKVKPYPHRLTIFIQHGPSRKTTFRDLQHYDIVLTTFGMLASELKRREKFALRQKNDPDARPTPKERCAILGEDAKWYRVVLDEAQCIKNKTTQTAKAAYQLNSKYRFCMTGTPMMNNIEEFYSLVNFLRINPYCRWEKFRIDFVQPLKSTHDEYRDRAMHKFQTLCKAIMLRRTKKSQFEGKPILVLPERTTEVENPEFDDQEQEFYKSIESKTRLQFNKYLKRGEVGTQYTAILVLLLRLRQAACHPHLIKDFGIATAADITEDDVLKHAKELSEPVVARIKSTGGNFECPVCYDAVANPAIFVPCGHDTCRECYTRIMDPANAIRDGNENGGGAKCPNCRAPIDPKRVTDFDMFKKVHMPEMLTAEELAELKKLQGDEDSETESGEEESEDDGDGNEGEEDIGPNDEVDENGDLIDFVVKDGEVDENGDAETESEAEEVNGIEEEEEGTAGPSTKSAKSKGKKKAKDAGKGKKKPKKKKEKKNERNKALTLAELKKASMRNAKARKAYIRRLRMNYEDSAKIRKTMELLEQIVNDAEGEKILVFSQWTSLLDLLEVPVDGAGWDYRRYDGSMNTKARADAVDDFRDHNKNVRIMLVSLKAGNAGLNLNMANQVIILDPFWNPYIEEQAIDRAHRIGQTRPVKVHRILVKETVEDRIIELQEKKRALISEALDEKASQNIARLGVQELAYLFGVTRRPNEAVQYTPVARR